MGSKEKESPTQQWMLVAFLVGFSFVALGMAIPGLRSTGEDYLEATLNREPRLVQVGWRHACVGKEACDSKDGEKSLGEIFSHEARDVGRGLVFLLSISCASALFVMVLGLLGLFFNVWFARTAIAVACVGALAGVTLLFLTPRFADEVLSNLKSKTRNRFDVDCDGQVVCSDVYKLEECEDLDAPGEKRLARSCEWNSDRDKILCTKLDGDQFDVCDTTSFLKACDLPKVVCKLDKKIGYIFNLGLGLHWLMFGLVIIAIFVPKVRIRKNIQRSVQKPPAQQAAV